MKNAVLRILITLIGIGCFGCSQQQHSAFYDKVLFSTNSTERCYVVLNAKSETFNGKIVATSGDFYHYFSEKYNLSEKEYKKKMIKLLSKKQKIFISDAEMKQYYFDKVPFDKEVEESFLKGKEYFMDKYIVKEWNTFYVENDYKKDIAIIAKLFEMEIAVYRFCESGALGIK